MKVLSVAEKPSVAKELASIIGGGNARRRNGHSHFNHIFDIDNCQVKGQTASMSITSVLGHLMELEFDESYQKWSSCLPEQLFTAPIKKEVGSKMLNLKKTLAEESRKCNTLLLWLDCDLEGENIAFEVIAVCREANPRLDIYRARFSALIPRDIMRTLQNPERPNANMSDAVDARQEIDLRLGAAFTRFQTMRLQAKFEALKDSVLSYGPCQFPTLGFVVERFLKIKNFIPEDFWSISCECETDDPDERSGKLTTRFSWERGRLYDELACLILYEMCIEGEVATVTDCKSRPTPRQRPPPLNTIELQKRASRFFHMGSDETMKVAEALYQRGILSYPRTETDSFKEGFELIPLLEDHRTHHHWGNYVTSLLQDGKFTWPRSGGHDDQAHPPIHPTKCVPLDLLSNDQERNIYELVTRHFIACCSQDARGNQTTVNIMIPYPNGEEFQATGLMVLERNWLDVYSKWEKWTGNKVASFQIGDTFTPRRMEMTAGTTAPPLLLSESDLISEMDKTGIGTDATIAQHISTIQERNYAFKNEQQRFVPTDRGIGLIEGYNEMGYQLNKPFLRASMEQDCQKIVRGELRKEDMIRNCLEQMKTCFMNCSREAHKLDQSMSKYFLGFGQAPEHTYRVIQRNLSTCGVCHNGMDLKVSRDEGNTSRFLSCGECQTVHTMPKNGELAQTEHECPICKYQVLVVMNAETGKEHTICPKCFSDPPGPPYSIEGFSGEFRCFMCNHPTCSLASRKVSEITLSPCYEKDCNGTIKLKRAEKTNTLFFGCNKYPSCRAIWWLPKNIKQVEDTGAFCPTCTALAGEKGRVSLLKFSVNMAQAPPGCLPEFTACPCCSNVWEDLYHTPMKCPRSSHTNLGNRSSNGQDPSSRRPQSSLPTPQHSALNPFDTMEPVPANTWSGGSSSTNYMAAASGVGYSSRGQGRAARGRGRTAQSSGSSSPMGRGGFGKEVDRTQTGPICQCGEPSVPRTVVKEGENKGRLFYTCPKPREEKCNYFCWADEASESTSRSIQQSSGSGWRGGGGESGRGRSGGGRGSSNSMSGVMICSRCKQSGHFARNCPSREY